MDRLEAQSEGRPFLATVVSTLPMLVLAIGLEVVLTRLTHLPRASYGAGVLFFELARSLASASPLSVLALAAAVAAAGAAWWTRSLGPRWRDFEHGSRLRILMVATAAVLAWSYGTYPYNFYFDQGHRADRMVVLLLPLLVVWRPVFILPFLIAVLPIVWQFSHPIGGYSWAAPILLVRVLCLMGALWLLRCFSGRPRTADFVFLLCSMLAAHYWVSGFGKLRLGWLQADQIALLLPATYANGWLGFMDADAIGRLTSTLTTFNGPLKLGAFLVECGAVLALWRVGVLRALLAGWIGLHAAIFLLTGIGFWHWALLDGATLALFFSRSAPELRIFTRPRFLLSMVLVGGGALWLRPVELAWLDARASYTYRFEALTESGQRFQLPPRFFAPYDYQFTLTDFRYLVDASRLRITWGATLQRDLVEALDNATSAAQVLALEASHGVNAFDPERAPEFDAFIRKFVSNWNARGAVYRRWTLPEAPPLLWTFPQGPPPPPGERISRVVVREIVTFFDGSQYREIRSRSVREIVIPRAGSP